MAQKALSRADRAACSMPLCSLNHPEREHVTDIVSHYAAPACGTKLGYVDQPSGRYSSAKPGSKNLSTALGAFSAELIFPN